MNIRHEILFSDEIKRIKYSFFIFFSILYSSSFFTQQLNVNPANDIVVIENNDTLLNPWTGGLNAVQISKIDLNFDSMEDLFIFDRTGNKVLTYINSGDSFIYDPSYESKFPTDLRDWVLLRDFNNDNKKDIFCSVSGGIGVWLNTSNGGELSFTLITNPFIYSYQYATNTNLYVSVVDIPAIDDIDGDGDLDILSFGVLGSRLEYHKNLSVENGYSQDSLIYELKNACWGHFREDGLTNTCILYDTCSFNVSNPESSTNNQYIRTDPKRHSGSTILSLDLNNDNVRDIILGDVSFGNFVALYNDNIGVNQNTSFISKDTTFPSNSVPADIYIYPASFYEDVDFDGVKDFIASPNSDNDTEDKESIWYYKNYGTNDAPLFYFQQKNFLQDETIELGRGAKPFLVDINNDELMDLIVSNFGEFDLSVPIHYSSSIKSYLNIGTASNPIFSKTSDDFQNISSTLNQLNLAPTFGDLDADGDLDVIVGDFDGNLHYFENTSTNPNQMNLTLSISPITDQFNNIFDVGYCAHPTLFDIDNDNDLDLIVGEAIGNLNYIENKGDSTLFDFELISETFGQVDVSEWWTNIGSSAPVFKTIGQEVILFVGSERGKIFKYNNISNNLSGSFNLLDSNLFDIYTGPNNIPAIYDINNDSILDYIIGNKRGGLSLYYGSLDSNISAISNLNTKEYIIYPNPSNTKIHIDVPELIEYQIFNLEGAIVKKGVTLKEINIEKMDNGIYFLSFIIYEKNYVLKFIKCPNH